MDNQQRMRTELDQALTGAANPLAAADQLCLACVELLGVDGAAISVTYQQSSRGTFGSSGELSRRLDELQFTLGEGPCLDAIRGNVPVLADDLNDPAEQRWPAFVGEVLRSGISAVFAMPVSVHSANVGALDLFREQSGPLSNENLWGARQAAYLASLPLLDLMVHTADADSVDAAEGSWAQLATLERMEVYQATGMVIGALGIDPSEALARLRAHAFSQGMTASELAFAILDQRVTADADEWSRDPGDQSGSAR